MYTLCIYLNVLIPDDGQENNFLCFQKLCLAESNEAKE